MSNSNKLPLLTAAQRSKDNGPVQTQATLGG
jgi:hypothetical protein